MSYVDRVLDDLKARYKDQPEFLQTAEEVLESLRPVINANPKYEEASLVERLDRICGEEGKTPGFLLEVNVSGEESKSGITPEETEDFIKQASAFPHIRVKGLMTMAPFDAENDELHQIFSLLNNF